MKKSISLMLIIFSLVSCKMDGEKKPPTDIQRTGYGGMEEPISKTFTTPEIQIGKRICSLLEGKRKMLDSYRNNQKQQLIFTSEAKACGQSFGEENAFPGNSIPTPFKAYVSLTGSRYELIAPTRNKGEYFDDIITRDSGIMGTVCNSLNGAGEISRQYPFEGHNMVVKFLVQNSMDRIEITQYSSAPKGGYTLANIEGVSFVGSTRVGPAIVFGLEKERARYTPCTGNQTPSSLKQTWLDLTTDL
jgi:hypothetical protein